MSIAEQIAAEHPWGMFTCGCGEPVHTWNALTTKEQAALYADHLAAMTERAVRERIEADIEAAPTGVFWHEQRLLDVHDAAAIARGEQL